LVTADLDARELVVVPDPVHAEAEGAKGGLSALDRAQFFVGDFRVVRNARRQAGRRRLVPGWQAGLPGQLADLVFAEIDFVERASHTELARRLAPRTVVVAIVGVAAVDDDRAAAARHLRQVRVQLVLAVITAVRRIG